MYEFTIRAANIERNPISGQTYIQKIPITVFAETVEEAINKAKKVITDRTDFYITAVRELYDKA